MGAIVQNLLKINTRDPAGIYLLKVNNRITRIKCEICSKLTLVNFEHISHFVLVFLLLPLNGWGAPDNEQL